MPTKHKYQKMITPDFEFNILNSEDSKFYKEVLAKAKKDFPNAYSFISNNIDAENVKGSNFFFACLADEELGKSKRIPTYKDWADMLNGGNFAKGFYFDANQLILRSDKDNFERNQPIINDLTRKLNGTRINGAPIIYTPENPLIITYPKLRKSNAKNNEYKLILSLEDTTFENNSAFASGKDEINLGSHPKILWTKSNGVSSLYLIENCVNSNSGNLASSCSNGRVAVLDAAGVASAEFDKYLIELEEMKKAQIKNIEERYSEAVNIFKGN